MSRIGDALKRSGAPDIAQGLRDLPLSEVIDGRVPASASPTVAPAAPTLPVTTPEEPAPAPHPSPAQAAPSIVVRPESRLVLNPELPALAVEQYRRLAATLHHLQEDRGVKRVMISSAVAEEGKTLTSTNLALTLSHSYAKRVLLIDADLRRPRVHVGFHLPQGPGLSEALDRRASPQLPVSRVSEHLSILPAGRATPDPFAGLTSPRMAAILEDASDEFDWVIVDTPPAGLLSDARLLGNMVDVALLVIGAGSTPTLVVQRAIEGLGRDRVLGVVLNRVDESMAAGGEYYGYYGYYGEYPRNGHGFLKRLLRRR